MRCCSDNHNHMCHIRAKAYLDSHNYMCHIRVKGYLDSNFNEVVIDKRSYFHEIASNFTYSQKP